MVADLLGFYILVSTKVEQQYLNCGILITMLFTQGRYTWEAHITLSVVNPTPKRVYTNTQIYAIEKQETIEIENNDSLVAGNTVNDTQEVLVT